MPTLRELVDPATTALLTMELQRGVTGDLAGMVALADEVRAAGVIDNVAALCRAARRVGVPVVHNTAVYHPTNDRIYKVNSRIQAVGARQGRRLLALGQPGAEVMPELEPQESDITIHRLHGMTPFTATSLDQILRNMGITTIIGTGNSVNIGVVGMTISAVDLGYQVVVPRDAVAGVPQAYADAVLDNTIALLSTVTTTADILAAWADR